MSRSHLPQESQNNHRSAREFVGDDPGGEVGPSLTRVEDDAVGGDDDCLHSAQLRVGTDRQADLPGPAMVSG